MTDEDLKTNPEHPVWQVYDLLRTAKLNVEYYTVQLNRATRRNSTIEILIAAAVPSSGLAGLAIWATSYGRTAWAVLTPVAAILAVAKPNLNLTEAIQRYEASISWYRAVQGQLSLLRDEIFRKRMYSEQMAEEFRYISRIYTRAEDLAPADQIDENLRRELYNRIKKEMPNSSFYVPD